MVVMAWVVGMLVWTGATLIIDAWQRARHPRRPDLTERLMPFWAMSVADEAEAWLAGQQPERQHNPATERPQDTVIKAVARYSAPAAPSFEFEIRTVGATT